MPRQRKFQWYADHALLTHLRLDFLPRRHLVLIATFFAFIPMLAAGAASLSASRCKTVRSFAADSSDRVYPVIATVIIFGMTSSMAGRGANRW